MILKTRLEKRGQHVYVTVFMGDDSDHMKNSGTLVMDLGQWQLFGTALLFGQDSMKGRFTFVVEDEMKVLAEFNEEWRKFAE